MITRLIEALRGLNPSLSVEELADALWLAGWLPRDEDTPAYTASPLDVPAVSVPPHDPAPITRPDEAISEDPPTPSWATNAPQAGLYLAGKESTSTPFAIRAPAVPALPRSLRLSRALRPLRVPASSVTREEMDENATARHVAETGVWQPIMRPSPERWLDLALVVDASVSMAVWGGTVEELQTLLVRLGAFRDVRSWRMDTDRAPLRLSTGASGAGHSPDELIDATRRRVILVVSDCIGAAWHDGSAAALLERWGRTGPVAIVQPLPQRLWWRSGAAIEPVTLDAPFRGAPNDRLIVRPGEPGAPVPPGMPVPVMELAPRWLGPWASMVATGGEFAAAALFTGRPVAEEPPPDLQDDGWPPVVRVMRFRAASSPTAFKLAGYLAAAPLRLQVMRLVQRAMLPESSPAHLAEVFLGGLLRTVRPGDGAAPDDITYEFHDGVRDVLLGSLNRGEALRVLREVWEVVRDRFGSTLDFAALLGAIQRNEGDLPFDRPFAQVAAPVLARLGGRYTQLAERLTSTLGTAAAEGPVQAATPVIWGGIPPRNPNFTGRDDLLRAVRDALDNSVTALLPRRVRGLGGEGKSQLAVEYAHRFAHEYDIVWWIPAEQATLARSALALLASRVGTPLSDDLKGTVDNVLQALRDGDPHRRWLLIYDNAREPDEVVPLMPLADGEEDQPLRTPHASGHVLVTSRDRTWDSLSTAIEVNIFDRTETIAFLRRRVPGLSADEADRLAELVGALPLAVEQAAAWQVATGDDIEAYRRLYERRLAEFPKELLPHIPRSIATASSINLDRLRQDQPVAARLLDLWGFFGPEPVPARLLTAGSSVALPAELAEVIVDEDRLHLVWEAITRYALGRFDRETGTLQVHRLMRDLLRARLSETDRIRVRGYVHAILAEATPADPSLDESTWEQRAEITPHVVPAEVIEGDVDIRHVATDQAHFLFVRGDFEGSRYLAELAVNHWREHGGTDNADTLEASRFLANALRLLGDLPKAAILSEDTWQRMRVQLGENHPGTLLAANGYGADLRFRGDFLGAYQLDHDTLDRMRRWHEGHPNLSLVANNVAIDLRLLGRFEEAYQMDAEALRWLESQNAQYRNIYRTRHNLARDLHGLGRYAEALRLQQANLDSPDDVLTPDNIFVLQAKVSHSGTLRETGAFTAAERLAAEAYEAHVRRFGEVHPSTIAAKIALALAGISGGDPARGLAFIKDALASYQAVLGSDHPFVHACAAVLGIAQRARGEVANALETDEVTLSAIHESPLGPEHHYALCCAVGLANDLYLLNRAEEARELSTQTLGAFQQRYGTDHPHTLRCAHNHEIFFRATGESVPGVKAVVVLTRILGEHHPHVRAAVRGELLECPIEPTPL